MNWLSQRDLRNTDQFAQVQEHYQKLFAGAGSIFDAVDPCLSPDGKLIAFAGKYLMSLQGTPFFKLCVFDTTNSISPAESAEEEFVAKRDHARTSDGGAPERLKKISDDGAPERLKTVPGEPCSCRFPQWSPDGKELAFLSDMEKKGHLQLHFYDLSSESITHAPEIEGIIEYFSWSPDGERLILGVAAAGADLAGAQGSGAHAGDGNDLPDWMPTVQSGDNENQRRTVFLFDRRKNSMVQINTEKNVWEAAFAGNDAVTMIVSEEPGEGAWYFAQLALYEIKTGRLQILYKAKSRQLGIPRATPSGSQIAFIEAICSDRLVIAGDVMLMKKGANEPQKVDTLSIDAMQVQWLDEHVLFFIGQNKLHTAAAVHDTRTGASTEIWHSEETCGAYQTDAFANQHGLVLTLQSYTRHPELVLIKEGAIKASHAFAHRGVQYINESCGRIEPREWQGRDGLKCSGFLVTPNTKGPYPLIVRIHGGPVWAFRNFWMMRDPVNVLLVKQGYAMFFPNPRGSTGQGPEFL